MTAQISDTFTYQGSDYSIVALSSEQGLFDPEDYGLHPNAIETCCWAGFWCEFEISDALYLQRLAVHCGDGNYPDICGRSVSIRSGVSSEQNIAAAYRFGDTGYRFYENIKLKIPYTGKILAGSGFIHQYYIHMGFQRAYAYRKLLEFEFEDGILIRTTDLSDQAGEYRKKIDDVRIDEFEHRSDIPTFIRRSFSQSYDDKAPEDKEAGEGPGDGL